ARRSAGPRGRRPLLRSADAGSDRARPARCRRARRRAEGGARSRLDRRAPMKKLVLASSNPGKLREFESLLSPLGIEIVSQATLKVAEAEEPHGTFVENALAKARHASRRTGLPALADDSGICVRALDGRPGVHSARFAGAAAPGTTPGREAQDLRNNEKLVALLDGKDDRRAHYYCVVVLVRHAEDPEPIIAEGSWA